MTTLLPPNSTELEYKLETAKSAETNLERRLNSMINVDSIPDVFLDFLAVQLSVDYWRFDWVPSLKRSRLKQAFDQHRKKGTPYAIKKALEPFGYAVKLVEWWQTNPVGIPGTFYLELDLVGKELTEETYKEVNRLIDETKPASRRISSVNITSNPVLNMGNIIAMQDSIIFDCNPGP